MLKRGDVIKCGHRNKFGNYPRDGTGYDVGAWNQLKRLVPKYAIFDEMKNVSQLYWQGNHAGNRITATGNNNSA